MRKFFQILLAAIILVTFFPASAYEMNGDYIEYEGIAYPGKEKDPNRLQRMAQLIAYQKLAEQVSEVNVDSSATVKNVCELDETANFRVQAALRNMRYVKEFRDRDGSFHAIIRLYIHGVPNSLASAVLNQNVQIEDFPEPIYVNVVSDTTTYSGVIIDCRGQNLSQAIAPSIKAVDGMEVYAYKNVGYQAAVTNGMIGYSTSVDSGVERAGSSPLRIKAVKISGGCDVVISTEDASKILEANKSTNFLNNCAVVLVR